jgi:DNA-binding SARP family transcriptional activator
MGSVVTSLPASRSIVQDHAGASVSVTCFGTFSVVVDGQPVENWRSGRARALLQYLITHRGRPVARDVLIDALWPDPDALAAGTSLKVAVHALRQTLKVLAADMQVLTHAASYELRAPNVRVDVEEFEQCCRLGHQLERSGAVPQALAQYEHAAELHRDDFLADSTDEWMLIRREGLRDEYLYVVARLADGALATDDYHTCIRRCRQILEQDRCREDAFRLLMLCYGRLGQPSRVQRWYNLCARTLRLELGVGPARETLRLFQDVLGHAPDEHAISTSQV